MSQNWYLSRDGQTFGPFPAEQLQAMARDGRLAVGDFVAVEGASQWVPAGSVEGLFPRLSSASGAWQRPVAAPERESSTPIKIPGRHRVCPRCTSSRSSQHSPLGTGFFSIVYDRKCKDCGTVYSPPIPAWAPYGLAFAGLILVIGGGVAFYVMMDEFGKLRPNQGMPGLGKGVIGLGALIVFGFGLIGRAWHAWKNPDA